MKNTNLTNIDVKIDRIVASTKVSFGKKGFRYFVEYEDDSEKVMLFCIMLSKVSVYRRDFEETKYMYFLIKDNELLEKFN